MSEDIDDYELGNSSFSKKELIERAFATGDDEVFEKVLLRVTDVRHMAKKRDTRLAKSWPKLADIARLLPSCPNGCIQSTC